MGQSTAVADVRPPDAARARDATPVDLPLADVLVMPSSDSVTGGSVDDHIAWLRSAVSEQSWIDEIAASIAAEGQLMPVELAWWMDGSGYKVREGHHRCAALAQLGRETVAVVHTDPWDAFATDDVAR
jgi:uncharacterized ParB-like nuclease family protein